MQRTGSFSPSDLEYYEHIASLTEEEYKAELAQSLSVKSREQAQWWNDSTYNNLSQPVVGVTWFEVQAYCAWLSAVTGKTYRLLTEVKWEAAARGHSSPSQEEGQGERVYPWGNDWDASRANTI